MGAVLTQSAAWANVEKAIANLKAANVLSPAAMRDISLEELAGLIRCSGYFNAKAKKLKALVGWLGEQGDNLEFLCSRESAELRRELLAVHGIGPETADSILLYAASKPLFVIDAYTRRIFGRLGIRSPGESYADWQRLFMDRLEPDVTFFNEYHALLVRLGKEVCHKKTPRCRDCCLAELCLFAAESGAHP